mmetsp:Transcript_23169/g.50053  ORF Transcript_23169/g.50053 Transcript_23169/m.50053 type:complete len:412 (+) Transcript_23169:334-1569(+)
MWFWALSRSHAPPNDLMAVSQWSAKPLDWMIMSPQRPILALTPSKPSALFWTDSNTLASSMATLIPSSSSTSPLMSTPSTGTVSSSSSSSSTPKDMARVPPPTSTCFGSSASPSVSTSGMDLIAAHTFLIATNICSMHSFAISSIVVASCIALRISSPSDRSLIDAMASLSNVTILTRCSRISALRSHSSPLLLLASLQRRMQSTTYCTQSPNMSLARANAPHMEPSFSLALLKRLMIHFMIFPTPSENCWMRDERRRHRQASYTKSFIAPMSSPLRVKFRMASETSDTSSENLRTVENISWQTSPLARRPSNAILPELMTVKRLTSSTFVTSVWSSRVWVSTSGRLGSLSLAPFLAARSILFSMRSSMMSGRESIPSSMASIISSEVLHDDTKIDVSRWSESTVKHREQV